MEENTETIMPGFTNLQKAQPVTLAHHVGAYFEMFKRDRSRLHDIYDRMNYCPLGAGALAGTTYPLDREYTASLLGFEGPTLNSMDSVSDRDYVIEFLSALSTIMMPFIVVRIDINAPYTRPVFPRTSSAISGFFFCGMILLPVLYASSISTN